MIKFTIHGNPKALKRHRNAGNFHYDPSRQDKEDFLILAHANRPPVPFECPLSVEIQFFFQRPKSHYGTGKNSKVLKPKAPQWHTGRPDIDNLIKFVADSLNGVFWKDDSIICSLKCEKKYSSIPRTEIFIQECIS